MYLCLCIHVQVAPLDDRLAQRLEKVWEVLEMPMLDKLGMVVKV